MALPSGPAVVLTRLPADNREMAATLRARGVLVREIPCSIIHYREPDRWPGPVAALVFSSRQGVRGLWRSPAGRRWWSGLGPIRVAAVGPATAEELQALDVVPDPVADPPRGEVLAEMLRGLLAPGDRVAVVRGNLRASGLDEALARAGCVLEPIEVYENAPAAIDPLEPFAVAAIFVAAPSAPERLLATNPWMRDCPFVASGTTTAAALREMGVASVALAGKRPEDWTEVLCSAHRRAVREQIEGV